MKIAEEKTKKLAALCCSRAIVLGMFSQNDRAGSGGINGDWSLYTASLRAFDPLVAFAFWSLESVYSLTLVEKATLTCSTGIASQTLRAGLAIRVCTQLLVFLPFPKPMVARAAGESRVTPGLVLFFMRLGLFRCV